MGNLIVFAGIGLLIGAAARLMYPGRQLMHVLGTLLLGAIGGLAGGMISWSYWPDVVDQFHSGNLFVSAIGASAAIVVGAAIHYMRKIGGRVRVPA